jgi:hypothetical protein
MLLFVVSVDSFICNKYVIFVKKYDYSRYLPVVQCLMYGYARHTSSEYIECVIEAQIMLVAINIHNIEQNKYDSSDYTCTSVWVRNLISNIKGGTQTKGV